MIKIISIIKIFTKLKTLILALFVIGQTFAQESKTKDFYSEIKNYNLSAILTAESFLAEDNENEIEEIERAEIIGFIGSDYQRFFIHFISVIQNPNNPYEYLAFGKTKVKEVICSFHGSIKIRTAKTYLNSEIPKYTQGFTTCDVILYEDNKELSTGFIKGTLQSAFVIDKKGKFRYDATSINADGFSNNDFIGTWTSFKTKTAKKCHWGDYRIPECNWSNGCDIGAGEFSISDKYLKNGWENYRLAYSLAPDKPESIKAKLKEKEKWWQ